MVADVPGISRPKTLCLGCFFGPERGCSSYTHTKSRYTVPLRAFHMPNLLGICPKLWGDLFSSSLVGCPFPSLLGPRACLRMGGDGSHKRRGIGKPSLSQDKPLQISRKSNLRIISAALNKRSRAREVVQMNSLGAFRVLFGVRLSDPLSSKRIAKPMLPTSPNRTWT